MVKRLVIDVLTNGVWWRALAFAGLVAMLPHTVSAADAQDVERDWTFVRQVLLTYEFKKGNGNIYRWSRSPRYFAFLKHPSQNGAVRRAIDQINTVLDGIHVTLVSQRPVKYDALISVIDQSEMQRIWAAAGCGEFFKHEVDGATCIHVDAETDAIDSVLVLIDEDQDEHAQASALLEEIYQSFGVRNDHQIFYESLTYDGRDRVHRTKLAPIDKKVLIFLYKYLEPGDDEATVRRKFDAHWYEIVVE